MNSSRSMNSSQFMDKQIMGLSGSPGGGGGAAVGGGDFFDLMNPQEERHGSHNGSGGVLKKEEILPSYDFQPIRTVGSSSSPTLGSNNNNSSSGLDGPARHSWGSADSKAGSSGLRYSNILESNELSKVTHEQEREAYDVATVAEIDRTVKKYADNLLHTLEGVSSRLSQLESRTRHLEGSVDELKVSVGNTSGSNDGKLRQLENILREVQACVQVMRDKQEIAEAQLQLAKLQQASSKPEHLQPPSETSSTPTGQPEHQQQPPVQQPPSYHMPAPIVAAPQPPPPLPVPNAPPPPPPSQQNPPTQFLHQTQIPSLSSLPREPSYFPTTGSQLNQPQPQPQQQPQPQPQPQAQPPPPQQHYQQLPQYSQPMPPPQPLNPSPQFQPSVPHHPEELTPYMAPPPPPAQSYPPNIRQPAPLTQPPHSGGPAQYYGPSSGQLAYSSSYGPPPGPSFSEPSPYSGSPSHYSSSTMRPSPFSNSPPTSGGGGGGSSSNYSRLPTAKILPQAGPAGQSSAGSGGNRVPIDDVVDKVSTMGFSREQVRATVRRLTENGQSVDLNVVLDKLMNGGGGEEMVQPQKGWFGR